MYRKKLIVFLKAPQPGQVKTRLARFLGPAAACQAYQILLARLLANLNSLPHVHLCFTPHTAWPDIQPFLRPSWSASPQSGGHLGAKLQAAFGLAFAQHARRVVVIGSDCPYVYPHDILNAWRALGEVDLVLGPAHDGGYWLVGLRKPQPRLFEHIRWSSPHVLSQTLKRARQLGLTFRLLSVKSDVDTNDDWEAFVRLHHSHSPAL